MLVEQTRVSERARDRLRREGQTPVATEPDATYWTRAEEWLLLDAALLLVNLEPRAALGLHLKTMMNGDFAAGPFVRESETVRGLSDAARQRLSLAKEIRENAQTAARNDRLVMARHWTTQPAVQPRDFLVWARDRGYALPVAFESLVELTSREELNARIAELQGQLAATNRWPWGNHSTELLDNLAAAADQFWKPYDPSGQTAAPTNKQVKAWLIDRGVADRVAEIMAQMLRASDPTSGPRK